MDTSGMSCVDLKVPHAVVYGDPWQVNALAWNDSTNSNVFCFNCNFTGISGIAVSDDHFIEPGNYSITTIDWSNEPRSRLIVTHNITVLSRITAANVSALPLVVVRNETVLQLVVTLFGGTDVTVSVDWNDGSVDSTFCPDVYDVRVVEFNKTYQSIRTFTVTGFATNILGTTVVENQTIAVYERIRDLVLFGNISVLTPPGTGLWGLMAGPEQFPLENIICLWNMGSSYSDMTYDAALINLTTDHEITFSYAFQADVGKHTISVNCSNVVSSQKLKMDVNVIWDNVTLGELACNSSTLWNHSITCRLNIVRFGTGACFEWDMGDGTALVYYQDAYCAVDVSAASPIYVQVNSVSVIHCIFIIFTVYVVSYLCIYYVLFCIISTVFLS